MNETIKKLRKELHLPLKMAMELVKEYGEDFEICKEKYHQNQIFAIAQTTECDVETAQEYYIRYLNGLNSRLFISCRVSPYLG